MSSNRTTRKRREENRRAVFAMVFAADRQRRKGGREADRLLDRLPRSQERGRALVTGAQALADAIRRSKLMDAGRGYRPHDPRPLNEFASGVVQLLIHHRKWIRSASTWTCRTHNAHRQFASLARHLLCRYEVPSCLDGAWFGETADIRRLHQRWFIQVGAGRNIRDVDGLPCRLTRRAAHLFTTRSPSDLPVLRALRWSQLRAYGADDALSRALLASRMADDFVHDAFWMTVVDFFMRHRDLELRHVGPIVDFIDYRRHRGVDGGTPDQPGFSMRGRTPRALLRQVDAWHRELLRVGVSRWNARTRWVSCGFRDFDRVEGEGAGAVRYRIRELLSAEELRIEGRQMHHCVASYVEACRRGIVGVFSMTRNDSRRGNTRLTIAVQPRSRQIVEARGSCNAMPSNDQRRVLRIWAQEVGLTLGAYL